MRAERQEEVTVRRDSLDARNKEREKVCLGGGERRIQGEKLYRDFPNILAMPTTTAFMCCTMAAR